MALGGFLRVDFKGDGVLEGQDAARLEECMIAGTDPERRRAGDFNGESVVNCTDAAAMTAAWTGAQPAPAFDACRGGVVYSVPVLRRQLLILLAALLFAITAIWLRSGRSHPG